ncbi:MAG: magnetosome biogenesis CDF transporter MamB [Magnetococcales bacterium]|nr:magnetosome biogenesis CDF transporter MamB [Magnetococcales bacterium]
MRFEYCRRCRNQAAWYSIFVNSFLVFYKGVLGLLTGCTALVADALHSSADVIGSTVTLASLRISARPPTERFSYGYGKVQYLSSSIIGMILIVGSTFILIGSATDIWKGTYEAPDRIALVGAFVSVVLNEMMYRYQNCVGSNNNSPAIIADALDNRADAFSSAAVLVGIGFATFGFPIADPIGAIIVALMVINIGMELISEAISGLTDASVEIDDLKEVYAATREVEGVQGVFYLRARPMGETLHVEVNIEVDERLNVYEGDVIVEALKMKLLKRIDHISGIDVLLSPVRIEPV